LILTNGYLEKGAPCVFCGPPGIGKTRLILQLAIHAILGFKFLDWETQGEQLAWLILQSENSMRRLKADLAAMTHNFTSRQLRTLDEHLFIHGLVTDIDGILHLSDPQVVTRITKVINACNPGVVVGDPLSGFSLEDLNSDKEMLTTAREFGRVARLGNQKRSPLIIQHARTGRSGAASASGYDRGSYARNSKALHGWTRAQINLSPFNEDNNNILVVARGKCNNASEFEAFPIELDKESMTYSVTEANLDEWRERVGSNGSAGRFVKKFSTDQLLGVMSAVTPMRYSDIFKQCKAKTRMSLATFKRLWAELRATEEISATEGKWTRA
jgi:hypothetical protein